MCAEDEDGRYRFDVRDLAGDGDAAADGGAAIRRAIDRSLDAREGFPYECGPGLLPSAAENQTAPDQPDDWDLLDLLAAVRGRTEPFGVDLDERQRAGLVQLAALAGQLSEAQRATLQGWLGG